MTAQGASATSEGLRIARLLMVMSSVSPLFILWAVRGNKVIPDLYFIPLCAAMVVVPNLVLWLRVRTARRQADRRELVVGSSDDHRDHVLVYLFAMLLPFYSEEVSTIRQMYAACAALLFVVFLFWHLNLHYLNMFFAIRGWRIYTVYPPTDGNPLTYRIRQALITSRVSVMPGDKILAYRVSDTVFLEGDE